jgi:hypothetical protein
LPPFLLDGNLLPHLSYFTFLVLGGSGNLQSSGAPGGLASWLTSCAGSGVISAREGWRSEYVKW